VLLTDQTGTHRSDQSDPPVRTVWHCCSTFFGSSVLALWINQGTQGFLVNHRKPRELGVASSNLHSWLGSHEVPARPWFWGLTKKPSTTSSCCSCHNAARTWPRWQPGPSNEAYLSSPHLEASSATTFRACSSPAPTPVRPQPAPAILSQESVHITLSITHHTRKRPSTGPRTTHGPQSILLKSFLALYIWEAMCWNFSHFSLIHALSTRGEVCACFWHLGAFGRCSNWFEKFLSSLVQGRSHGAV
jgi:hypothetical protein